MNKILYAVALGVLCVGCGEKMKELKDTAEAMHQVSKAVENAAPAAEEQKKIIEERKAKGDTVAMPYTELQKFLPESLSGYKMEEAPAGSSQNMGGLSMSNAEQKWVATGGDTNNPARVHISIVDFGGGETGYAISAAPLMVMNFSSEDAHQRQQSLKLDVPYTWASETYNKDSKEAKVTAITRYRYTINVEATNQTDDQSEMVKSVTTDLVKKFEGK
jgi:hypothetical protein